MQDPDYEVVTISNLGFVDPYGNEGLVGMPLTQESPSIIVGGASTREAGAAGSAKRQGGRTSTKAT